ncbi:hypothetical protein CRENPOLYSF2_710006 [Crenothrix polyspora]|uniref:Uncharacterized protein n=1 Tax=Crenothrix polyspora TaxID=360316 RepID=A0A1R4HHT0_9GAMM|nr:hypothetical protein CRENPOLYSF2_710006 [Crenothrix polyspora]
MTDIPDKNPYYQDRPCSIIEPTSGRRIYESEYSLDFFRTFRVFRGQ